MYEAEGTLEMQRCLMAKVVRLENFIHGFADLEGYESKCDCTFELRQAKLDLIPALCSLWGINETTVDIASLIFKVK